jgi:crotonobetainyl-CoA:carnitine CoA-transferase CaiB-like acyl-CoA transferase
VEEADVVVEGFRPGVADRIGIGYEAVSKTNPGIVYCSLTGYGQDGPYRDLPGHDINYISTAGFLCLNGESNGPPTIPYSSLSACAGPLNAALGILVALRARERSGKGQYVDIASTDSVVSLINSVSSDYFSKGIVPRRGDNFRNGKYPFYNVYQTKDGEYISLGCGEFHFWEKLCHVINREDFTPHQYAEGEKREEIYSYLKDYFGSMTQEECFDRLIRDSIPVSKVHSIDEVFSDPQILHRQMVIDVEHPELGEVKQIGIAIKLSDTPGKVRSTSPLLGEHTEEILLGLGYTEEQISSLREAGALG